jgi:sugar phosphate isomerase/epimerase
VKRRIGLAALTCMELAPHELVSVAAQAGYDCVGLRLIAVAGQTLPVFDLRETERRLADTGLSVLDVEVFRVDASTRVADFEPVLEQAARLGATEILAHGADPDAARLRQNFSNLCALAAKYGLQVNLEPMPWVEVSTVAQAKRVLEGNENAALLVDAIHFYRAENTFADLEGARMRYLQFCDAHPGRPSEVSELIRQARGDRLFPGEGALDLKGLLRATPAGLPLSLEVPVAQKLDPLERARRALQATEKVLGSWR